VGIGSPGTSTYRTREILAQAAQAGPAQLEGADFWKKNPDQLWSERIRQACNMCGFCGEYLCWGGAREVPGQTLIPGEPKSGAHATVIQELRDMAKQPGSKVRVLCAARAYEITLNPKTKRANGVLYLDLSDPDHPEAVPQPADTGIVSFGAVAGGRFGDALGKSMKDYAISLELRLTADDLPMPRNRVDLDPTHVDEFGFPVARITREVGTHEWLMYQSVVPVFQQAFEKG